jgi:hypothetical protein
MIPEIIAGIGLGKLSEDVMNKREPVDRERAEEFLLDADEEDQVDWCPEMDNEE